jgi:hypothetical protein
LDGQFRHVQLRQRQILDDTLPIADGPLEIGATAPVDELREAIEDWWIGFAAKLISRGLEVVTGRYPQSGAD